ncbi:MAG: DUF1501 domain-containing protein [Saccharospirillum sp.]|nr:DUF1501 domain-containing protein [Saccharospirillum sp.]
MQRRDFLKNAAGAMASARWALSGGVLAGGLGFSSHSLAAAQDQRLVIQLTLDGGPDFRHLLVPKPSHTSGFAKTYWEQNYRTHGLSGGGYDAVMTGRWENDYIEVSLDGETFGVLKKAEWLADLLKESSDIGAALINNVVGSVSRDHVNSLLALDYGRHDTLASEYGRSGWGGRLADTLGGRVASLTRVPRNLCFAPATPGSNARAETDNLLTLESARNAGLFDQRRQPDSSERHWNAGQSRALNGYYAALQGEQTSNRMSRLLAHEAQLRTLGQELEDRLKGITIPEPISRLMSNGASPLNRTDFARQIATAHDLISHGADIAGMRVMSLDYHGWDSHDNQKSMIEPNFEDMFGKDRGLQAFFDSMDSTARNNTIIVINGEFGRQTRSNRDAGTDHGRGNSMLVLGKPVKTGIHGELFPESEVARMESEVIPDIAGRTTIEHLHKAVADWVFNGNTHEFVVNRSLAGLPLEPAVDLSTLWL